MKLEIYNSVHTSESVPSRVNVWREKERDAKYRERGQVRERVEGREKKGRDLISYASDDHTARGTVKSPEQNTTLNNELYVHNNIFPFSYEYQNEKGKLAA